jgi:hypothetical protein
MGCVPTGWLSLWKVALSKLPVFQEMLGLRQVILHLRWFVDKAFTGLWSIGQTKSLNMLSLQEAEQTI